MFMEERVHPIPFRTRQLSSPSSMILRILTWESRTTPRLYFQRAVLRRWPVVFLSCRHSCIPSAIPNQAILPLPPLFSSASPSLLPGFPPAFFQLPPGVLPSTPLEPSLSLSLSPSNGPSLLPVTFPLSLSVFRQFHAMPVRSPCRGA